MARKLRPWCKAVKIELIERDMTIADLAERIGHQRTYVSAVINGRVISEPVIKLICDELNLKDDYDESASN